MKHSFDFKPQPQAALARDQSTNGLLAALGLIITVPLTVNPPVSGCGTVCVCVRARARARVCACVGLIIIVPLAVNQVMDLWLLCTRAQPRPQPHNQPTSGGNTHLAR